MAHRQLVRLGFGVDAIQHRVATGRLHRLHVGVYAVGHRCVSTHGRWMAAVLACGDDAWLSHRDAGALWCILPSAAARIEVTVPGRARSGPAGIRIHLPHHIHVEDRATKDGIPVTSVARTLLDLAHAVPRLVGRALEEAERRGIFDLAAVDHLLARSRGRRGVRALRMALEKYRPVAFTRSELERRFLDVCERAGLPRPSVNLWVEGGESDVVWPDHRLVVELDSHAFHRTWEAFERDRRRDAALQLAGYRVLRVTHHRLEREPREIVRAVRALLDRR